MISLVHEAAPALFGGGCGARSASAGLQSAALDRIEEGRPLLGRSPESDPGAVLGVADEPRSVLAAGTHLNAVAAVAGRALIARALLPDPPLLLLDEPSTGLDVAAREQFLSTVDQLHRSRPHLATILVTHHLEELPTTTTHAMLVKHGLVHASGRAREILTTELVSQCFDHPIEIEHRAGRWQARALVKA